MYSHIAAGIDRTADNAGLDRICSRVACNDSAAGDLDRYTARTAGSYAYGLA